MSPVARRMVSLCAFVLVLRAGSAAAQEPRQPLHTRLPKDPLLVFAVGTDELATKLESAAGWLARSADGPQLRGLLPLDPTAGAPLAGELLAAAGPQVAVAIDLPPLDTLAAAIQMGTSAAAVVTLSESGLLAQVRDEQKLHGALRKLLEALGAPPVDRDGVLQAQIPLGADASAPSLYLDLFYATRDGRLALGFSRQWVLAGLADSAPAERLGGSEDFRRVFAHLDAEPDSLAYVNLPKLRSLIESSMIVAALVEGDPQLARFVAPLVDPRVMGSGLGSTSVAVGGGVRTMNFGPYWMSGPAASSSVLAALAVPSLLVAAERGRSRDTLGDIQSIARACEQFASDAHSYPGPTRGWIPVGEVSAFLEPIYITTLPRNDAWNNPLLYWSDGKTYRLMSTGPDGRMDRDWSRVDEPTESANKPGDIVIADGRILVLPHQFE